MNPSPRHSFLSGLTVLFLMAAGSCGTRSVIGLQTGQGGAVGTGGVTGLDDASAGGAVGAGGSVPPGGGGTFGATGGTTGGTVMTQGDGGNSGLVGAGGTVTEGDDGGFGQGGGGGNISGTGGSLVDAGQSCSASGSSPNTGLSFGAGVEYLTHAGSLFAALGDLNGDGKPDLAVGNYSMPPSAGGSGGAGGSGAGGFATGGNPGTNVGSVSVFLSSTGGYGPAQFYNVGNVNPWSIAAGDLNGDGKTDLAVVNDEGVSVLFNSGNGILLAPVSFATGTGPVWVALGDLNGDGKTDLAVANQGSNNGTGMVGGDVAVLLNMGGGTFVAANYPAGASPVSVAMADLNGDGKADLAVASGTGVSVLLNNGNGTFGAPASYGSGTSPSSVAAGDLNGDGKLDLVVGNGNRASVLLNLGNGTFAAAVNYDFAAGYTGTQPVAIGDLNGDGRPDLAAGAVADPCSSVAVLLNQGSGVFGAPSYVPTPTSNQSSVTLGDLNGDGKLDLVVPNGDGVAVLLNATP